MDDIDALPLAAQLRAALCDFVTMAGSQRKLPTLFHVGTPGGQHITLPHDAPLADIETACAETGFSRFPVRGRDEELVGYIHVKDVLETDPHDDDRLEDKRIRAFARVRPHHLLHEAFSVLRRRGAHLGRVVDDEGELLGLVALEDVLEELVGEIRDSVHS